MVVVIIGMLVCIALAIFILAIVALPASRGGRPVPAERPAPEPARPAATTEAHGRPEQGRATEPSSTAGAARPVRVTEGRPERANGPQQPFAPATVAIPVVEAPVDAPVDDAPSPAAQVADAGAEAQVSPVPPGRQGSAAPVTTGGGSRKSKKKATAQARRAAQTASPGDTTRAETGAPQPGSSPGAATPAGGRSRASA